MKDDRTQSQKYQSWVDVVNKAWSKGWMHAYGWVFYSPSGSKHDLSTVDLEKLDEVERVKLLTL